MGIFVYLFYIQVHKFNLDIFNLQYLEWSPALRVTSVCLSILSMLSSCKKKEKPAGDHSFSSRMHAGPKSISWY
jgi:ubiquitin-conjugating enzyme E2 W